MAISTLDALLGALSVDIEAFAICEIADGVRLVFPPINAVEVHHVLEGTLHLTIDENETIEVGAGAMLIVPPGRLQYLASSRETLTSKVSSDACLPIRDGLIIMDATDGRTPTLRIACGTVLADPNGSYGPLDNLSRPVAENLADVPVVSAAFTAMLGEVAAPTEGTMALTSALMKACLVVLLRRHVQTSRTAGIAPALFQHARLGRAIAAVLDHPAAAHSVTGMAKIAGMSRSAFAREFKTTVGLTPIDFVAGVRLKLAHRLLLTTTDPVELISASVGFNSRSHFSRLFRERYGADPSSFRRSNATRPFRGEHG
jgi:AraC family transcriptional regulator, activator of mtrCDE